MPRRTSEKPSSFPSVPGYHIESVLGRGSMATVYKAVQVGMDRPVALKVLRDDVAGEPKVVRRLMREARLAARLNHPHVVRAHDAGVVDGGTCYFVMEFIDGASVRDILMRRGKFDADRAVAVAIEIAEALFAFYREHIVHRDVKPANIMIDLEGNALLADLGLAKVEFDSSMTSQNRAVGTPAYMSPEQARDPDNVDSRSDVFSLGATLYHMVTGVSPFDAPTVGAVVTKILYDDPPPIRELDPDLSPDLERVVMRMLEKDRNARYETPGTLLRDLRALRRGAELPTPPVPDSRRRNLVLAAIGMATVAILVVVAMTRGDGGNGEGGGDGDHDTAATLGPAVEMTTSELVRSMQDDAPREHIEELERRGRAAVERVFARSRSLAGARKITEARSFIEIQAPGIFASELGIPFADLPSLLRTMFIEEQVAADLVVRRIDDEWQDAVVDTAAAAFRETARDVAAGDEYLSPENARARIAATPVAHVDRLDERRAARVERGVDDALSELVSTWRDRFETALSEVRALRDAGRLASARRVIEVERSRGPQRLGGGLTDRLDAAQGRIDEAERELQRLVRNRIDRIDRVTDDGHPELALRDTSRLAAALRETTARLPDDLDELTAAAADARLLMQLNAVVMEVHRLLTELDTAPGARPGARASLATIDDEDHEDVRVVSVEVDQIAVLGPDSPRPITLHARRLTPASLYALFQIDAADVPLVTAFLCYCDGRLLDAEAALASAPDDACSRLLRVRVTAAFSHLNKVFTPEGKAALSLWRESLDAARDDDWATSFAKAKQLVTTREWTATEWYKAHRAEIRAHYDRAAARDRIAATLGDRGGSWNVDDAERRLITGVYEFSSPAELKGMTLPAGYRVDDGRLVRESRARSVAPDRTDAVVVEIPLDLENESADVQFRYVTSSRDEEAPRCLTVGIGGHHVAFLGRLNASGGSAHLALHGLEREVAGFAPFSRVAYWKGDVSGYEAALRGDAPSGRFSFEVGKSYEVRVVVDPNSRRLTVTVDGDIVLTAPLRDLAATTSTVTLRAPMPHAIDSLRIRGAVATTD